MSFTAHCSIEGVLNITKPAIPIINPDTGLEVKKNVIISVLCVPDLSEEFRKIFQHTSAQGTNTLKSIHMLPKDKIPSQLKQNIESTNGPAKKKIATFFT